MVTLEKIFDTDISDAVIIDIRVDDFLTPEFIVFKLSNKKILLLKIKSYRQEEQDELFISDISYKNLKSFIGFSIESINEIYDDALIRKDDLEENERYSFINRRQERYQYIFFSYFRIIFKNITTNERYDFDFSVVLCSNDERKFGGNLDDTRLLEKENFQFYFIIASDTEKMTKKLTDAHREDENVVVFNESYTTMACDTIRPLLLNKTVYYIVELNKQNLDWLKGDWYDYLVNEDGWLKPEDICFKVYNKQGFLDEFKDILERVTSLFLNIEYLEIK
jgi:hypothetical protein